MSADQTTNDLRSKKGHWTLNEPFQEYHKDEIANGVLPLFGRRFKTDPWAVLKQHFACPDVDEATLDNFHTTCAAKWGTAPDAVSAGFEQLSFSGRHLEERARSFHRKTHKTADFETIDMLAGGKLGGDKDSLEAIRSTMHEKPLQPIAYTNAASSFSLGSAFALPTTIAAGLGDGDVGERH